MTLSSVLPCVLSRNIGSIVGSSLSWGCIYVPTPHHFCDIFVKLSIPHSFRSWNLAYICDCMKKSDATLHGFWPYCGENEGRLGPRGKGNAIAQLGKLISDVNFPAFSRVVFSICMLSSFNVNQKFREYASA